MITSKELVYSTLNGTNKNRAPRQLWKLSWADIHHLEMTKKLKEDFPDDIVGVSAPLKENSPKIRGQADIIGEYIDDFGCVFTNVQNGIIGEVKTPIVTSENWDDFDNVHIPYEWLSFEIDDVNRAIEKSYKDKFTVSGFCARPFERLQFIRGTENIYIDLMDMPPNFEKFIKKLHQFYCDAFEKWGKTDVDALTFMDDWGSQRSLLINPELWRTIFKPLYKDYIDIAKHYGKKTMMHSDGYIIDFIPDLIEIGLDVLNSQIFCMGIENLKKFAGQITFWGEIDRQHLLVSGTKQEIDDAVRLVYDNLYKDGFCIAQCEFGLGANPENVYQVFESWNKLTTKN